MKTTPKKNTRTPVDLRDTKDDKEHLQPDEGTLDLPEVKDIPGQEHVRPLVTGELSDTTISSSDEEGHNILDTDGNVDDDIIADKNSNVSSIERELLQQSSETMATNDDQQLKQASLDTTDDDNTALNEKVNLSGDDLDVPGSEEDDDNEEIGEEDEENNYYSRPDPEEE